MDCYEAPHRAELADAWKSAVGPSRESQLSHQAVVTAERVQDRASDRLRQTLERVEHGSEYAINRICKGNA